ncbi:hypothetical protein GCM10023333_27740 [Ferrimonas pelagia]|uniref:Uncharacterized protein n=1 Tax=Ferrimonas pelagia TaxID=1177826 RepID=A0ABP9F564_9GAMM
MSTGRLPIDAYAENSDLEAGIIGWDDGRLLELNYGQTATCTSLKQGQLYAVIIYNASASDHDIPISLVWSNSQLPENMTIPGTKNAQGPASVVLVSGNDTATVSISISTASNATVQMWILSVSMPSTPRQNLDYRQVKEGVELPLLKAKNYFAVAKSNWHQVTIENKYNQAFILQIQNHQAIIYIINPTKNPQVNVIPVGTVKEGKHYQIKRPNKLEQPQRLQILYQGNGSQVIWTSLSSEQNSKHTKLILQALQSNNGSLPALPFNNTHDYIVCSKVNEDTSIQLSERFDIY